VKTAAVVELGALHAVVDATAHVPALPATDMPSWPPFPATNGHEAETVAVWYGSPVKPPPPAVPTPALSEESVLDAPGPPERSIVPSIAMAPVARRSRVPESAPAPAT
jgi:hypothetical protein